jgi:hypothetical protein
MQLLILNTSSSEKTRELWYHGFNHYMSHGETLLFCKNLISWTQQTCLP